MNNATTYNDMDVQSAEKNFEFDFKVEQKFLTFHARVHMIYTLYGVILVSLLCLGVYLF